MPIADLLTESIKHFNLDDDTHEAYTRIPLAWHTDKKICPRVHQALFNEIVTIHEETADEVHISISTVFNKTLLSDEKKCTYWMLKESIIYLNEVEKNIDLKTIPTPIDFESGHIDDKDVTTLVCPFYDKERDVTYSAGTRFIIKEEGNDAYYVYAYDHKHNTNTLITIPKNTCIQTHTLTPEEKRNLFVYLVTSWAKPHCIPFVWGGCSFAKDIELQAIKAEQTTTDGSTYECWLLATQQSTPYSGFDISGLIARSAQICGIPYFYKNSTIAALLLKKFDNNTTLQECDLVWLRPSLAMLREQKVRFLKLSAPRFSKR